MRRARPQALRPRPARSPLAVSPAPPRRAARTLAAAPGGARGAGRGGRLQRQPAGFGGRGGPCSSRRASPPPSPRPSLPAGPPGVASSGAAAGSSRGPWSPGPSRGQRRLASERGSCFEFSVLLLKLTRRRNPSSFLYPISHPPISPPPT